MSGEKSGLPVVAVCYDFDKTLSPKNMQEYMLLDQLGVTNHVEFWDKSNAFAKREQMDQILSYMRLIVKEAEYLADSDSLTKKHLHEMGKKIELFAGVDTWFERINKHAEALGLCVEHYVISAGLKEMIEGTSIAKEFQEIYASSFYYDKNGVPKWPKQVVNGTQKTQYIFRINKGGCPDLSNESELNRVVEKDKRRIPFPNIMYLGDSDTDIPAMKVVTENGGKAIGVYNPEDGGAGKVTKYLSEGRLSFFAPADYSKGSPLEEYVKKTLTQIKKNQK